MAVLTLRDARARLVAAAGLCALLTAVLCGCDYFRPAQPEAPTELPFTPDYSDPDLTLETIALAIGDKGRTIGITAYAGAFAESTSASTPGFHQFFWPPDVESWKTQGRIPPPDWDFRLEQSFYVRFVNLRTDGYRMVWGPPDPDSPADDLTGNPRTIHRHYAVYTLAEDGSVTSFPAAGFADLTLFQFPDGAWRVTRWQDRIDPNPDPYDPDPNDPERVTLGLRRLNTQ